MPSKTESPKAHKPRVRKTDVPEAHEAAVRRAAPLPYQGFEDVFAREVTFNFKYDGQD